MNDSTITIGVSACLLGHKVRYDGGHRQHTYITETLARRFTLVSICPEIEAGLGIPREAIDLIGGPGNPRAIGRQSGTDYTLLLRERASRWLGQSNTLRLSGFILKDKSPSCALHGEKIVLETGDVIHEGVGIFAAELRRLYPDLPVIHGKDLTDDHECEMFLADVLEYHRRL